LVQDEAGTDGGEEGVGDVHGVAVGVGLGEQRRDMSPTSPVGAASVPAGQRLCFGGGLQVPLHVKEIDAGVQEGSNSLCWCGARTEWRWAGEERRLEVAFGVVEEGVEQPGTITESPVHGADADFGGVGDPVHRHGRYTLIDHDPAGGDQ